MSHLTSSQDKLQQLCDILQGQALEPARIEAQKLMEEARQEAKRIIEEAKSQVLRMKALAESEIHREKEVAHASLKQAAQQAIGKLRQEIEAELVNTQIDQMTHKALDQPQLVVSLLKKYIELIEAKGWDKDFSLEIAKTPQADQLIEHILAECGSKLKQGQIIAGQHAGGFRLKLHDKRMTLDASESALTELLGQFLRKEWRTRLFM